MNAWTPERRAAFSAKVRNCERAEPNPLCDDDRRLIRRLWDERQRLATEIDIIRQHADEQISVLRREAKQLTMESLARRFECSITQIHAITRHK